jgi:hypothetical protein
LSKTKREFKKALNHIMEAPTRHEAFRRANYAYLNILGRSYL